MIKAELEKRFERTIFGLDISADALTCKESAAVGDLLCLPFPDSIFDFALCNHVYEHVGDLALFFREIRRVMSPGGTVYVTAGSKYAIIEPHYRLPFLSWLPAGLADRYVKVTGRSTAYRGIRFSGYSALTRNARNAGFEVRDITRTVILANRKHIKSPFRRAATAPLSLAPAKLADWLLSIVSPQWFFFLTAADMTDSKRNA